MTVGANYNIYIRWKKYRDKKKIKAVWNKVKFLINYQYIANNNNSLHSLNRKIINPLNRDSRKYILNQQTFVPEWERHVDYDDI